MTRLQRSICPFCGARHDVASAVTSKADRPNLTEEPRVEYTGNSVSFCIECGESAVFDASAPGQLRFPTFEEAMVMMTMPELIASVAGWAKTMQQLGRRPRPILNRPDWMSK